MTEKPDPKARDYKDTVFLPKTDFPMKAGLPQSEPQMLAQWQTNGLWNAVRQSGKGREKFVLHDGPPYANGNLHIGHALNKILKDIIVRTRQMNGKDAHYVPGWDCHGLPIEWKIEEKYRADGKDKDDVPVVEFRQECREFAKGWIDIQREEFKRLGILGDWDNPYLTQDFKAEAAIAAELGKFLMDGSLYRGAKPVMWSVVEKTALAEAEVEYHDHTSITIWVKFPIKKASVPALEGAKVVIWTTTPWTIPGNRAVAYGPDFDYAVVEVEGTGEKLVVLQGLAEQVAKDAGVTFRELAIIKGADLAGSIVAHPLADHPQANGYYSFDGPLLAGDYVTTDTGTGFVHLAPGHGEDDWKVCRANGVAVPDTVQPDGTYYPHVAIFAGQQVLNQGKNGKYYSPVAKPVIEALTSCGNLLAHGKVEHSYPHSWRSKAPLIFRNTAQWFISMDTCDLRQKAMTALAETKFYPEIGRNRIGAMVEGRPDWCVSRQRAWGVPITVFVDKKTGQPLRDQAVLDRIIAAFAENGADAWYTTPASVFLGNERNPDDYEQVFDVLDVWFDSGSTHAFVLESDKWDLKWPADLYLEGSDQHRGWFQSSLLEACGTRGRAPYDAVLTHGFVLDEQGRKMSKSLGNVVSPLEVVGSSGADILRLWVTGSDYSDDLRIGPEIIKTQIDIYRRLRNTLRYLLGALDGFSDDERLNPSELPELEQWVLHRLWVLEQARQDAFETYQFHSWFADLHTFCSTDLSAFYFDVRKDSLYCDASESVTRRAARTVFDILLDTLCKWLAPFLVFTAEEAWSFRNKTSVHLEQFPTIPAGWRNDALAVKWAQIRAARKLVTEVLEVERKAKTIGSSLEASPVLVLPTDLFAALADVNWAEVCVTSGLRVMEGPEAKVEFHPASGEKCPRCWKVLPEVVVNGVCDRCHEAVEAP